MKFVTLRLTLLLLCATLFTNLLHAQFKDHLDLIEKNTGPAHTLDELRVLPVQAALPAAIPPFSGINYSYRNLPQLVVPSSESPTLQLLYADRSQIASAIYGEAAGLSGISDTEQKIFAQLEAVKHYLQIENPAEEFRVVSHRAGQNGYVHYKLQQYYREVPIYGSELTVHLKDNDISLINGRPFPTPGISRAVPAQSREKAIQRALQEVEKRTDVKELTAFQKETLGLQTVETELVIYHASGQSTAHLAWRLEVVPNIYHREVYFIDAHSGAVLFHHSLLCKAHADPLPFNGPAVGTATDLRGQSRTVNSYDINGTYLMIDASRAMFPQNLPFDPGDPTGVIWTLDAENQTPIDNDSFSVTQILADSPSDWERVAVSAHYNAGVAYEYFRNTFNRNSINGRGGTVISLINVAEEDGGDMENAFWGGTAMYYGNGGEAFQPLARALDVSGHELSHGVIQTTANLEYLSQSGAINESLADVFGAMMDREDWQIGEDVVNSLYYPTGALRDLSDPNNGGNGLSSNGWQPAHMNQYVNLPETEEGDNGGVHINSGIPNRAYYLFATEVGKDIAEQVYYNALTNYLTRLSQFVDLRIAVLASAGELYNNNVVNAAAAAFDQVGIVGDQGTDEPDDLELNTGNQVVLFANSNMEQLNIYNYNNTPIAEPLIDGGVLNKPSVSDDGSRIVYVDEEKNVQLIDLDWNALSFSIIPLTEDGAWRTAAISKDGTLLAALTDDFDDQLYVFRLDDGQGKIYTLKNPTTAEGISTGTVAYADILEWSLNGESVMYDALSTIAKVDGTIEFWDIGIIDVWNKQTSDFGDGYIAKLFTGLPEGISVGNPTFSKNSPYIIALDYIDENEGSYSILGANILTGDIGSIFNSSDLGSPNYSIDDREVIFDAVASNGTRVLGRVELASDKINRVSDAEVFISGNSGARWGVVFATGKRELGTDTHRPVVQATGLKVYPNPVRDQLQIELESPTSEMTSVQLFDPLGKSLYFQREMLGSGLQKLRLPLGNLSAGTYVLDMRQANRRWLQRIVKID